MLTGPMTARRSNSKTAYGLMSDIVAYILEEPKRVYMGDWVIRDMDYVKEDLGASGPVCGTVGCIAGNAVLAYRERRIAVRAGQGAVFTRR